MLSFATAPHQAQSLFELAANVYRFLVQSSVGVARKSVTFGYMLAYTVCVFLLSFRIVQFKYE